jgi:hypothetical protein
MTKKGDSIGRQRDSTRVRSRSNRQRGHPRVLGFQAEYHVIQAPYIYFFGRALKVTDLST